MNFKNKKAQAELISFVLVAIIVIIVVLASYAWGSQILDDRKESYAATKMRDKMFEIREAVMSVAQEGANSTRVVSVIIEDGKLYLDTSFIPVSCGQARADNGIIYEIATKEQIVNSESWANVDPYENETGDLCTVGGPSLSYPGVLFARHRGTGENGKYLNQYLLSFRNLKDISTGESHIIRIGSSEIGQNTTGIGEGTSDKMVRQFCICYGLLSFRGVGRDQRVDEI